MNPGGPIEEAGATARSIIHVLESQPLSLAMIISNFALLAYLWYGGVENNRQRAELGKAIFQEHSETRQLLAKCIVPERQAYPTEPVKPLGEIIDPRKPLEDPQ